MSHNDEPYRTLARNLTQKKKTVTVIDANDTPLQRELRMRELEQLNTKLAKELHEVRHKTSSKIVDVFDRFSKDMDNNQIDLLGNFINMVIAELNE